MTMTLPCLGKKAGGEERIAACWRKHLHPLDSGKAGGKLEEILDFLLRGR